jgi:hypothetical protein
VTAINGGAFSGCSSLTSLTIGNNVKTIGDWAFSDCSSLISVEIPNSVISIGHQVFENCTGLTSVTIGNNVTSIGFKAFFNCSSLKSITLGKSVHSIGNQAFEGCLEIASVNLNCETVNNWFSGFVKISEVVIGNNVKEIGSNAFFGCSDLTTVTIGTQVSKINEKAFASCPELANVYCYRENPPSAKSDTFEGSYIEYATLHVPESSIHLYEYYLPWYGFKKIVGLETADLAIIPANTMLVQNNGGTLNIQGAENGTPITIFTLSGALVGSAIFNNGEAIVNTNLQSGSIAIVKIGEKTIKVIIK